MQSGKNLGTLTHVIITYTRVDSMVCILNKYSYKPNDINVLHCKCQNEWQLSEMVKQFNTSSLHNIIGYTYKHVNGESTS